MKPETVRTTAVLLLFLACAYLLRGLLVPICWACLVAIGTWPLHDKLRRRFGPRAEPASAVLLSSAVVLFLVVPVAYLLFRGVHELPGLIHLWTSSEEAGLPAPAWVASLPGLGGWATKQWNDALGEPGALGGYAQSMLGGLGFSTGRTLLALVGHHAMAAFFCILVLFFLYLGGDALAAQIDTVLTRHVGPAGVRLRALAVHSIRGAVNGLVLVSLGVAVLMTVAYAVAGVPHPAALGLATGLFGMVPFGAMLVVAGVVLYLLTIGATTAAVWLAVSGAGAIFVADHFIRPVFMSGSSQLPLVLVLLGIIGGLETFGVLGIFIGPTLLAVMVAVWREMASPGPAAFR